MHADKTRSASTTAIRGGGELAAGVAPYGVRRDHKGVPEPAVVGNRKGLREEISTCLLYTSPSPRDS